MLEFSRMLKYSDREMMRSNKLERSPLQIEEMRILNTIAACLASGKRGDVVSAAFDVEDNAAITTLILVKNSDATQEDRNVSRRILEDVFRCDRQDVEHVWPTIATHCRQNINHRLARLVTSINNFRKHSGLFMIYPPLQTSERINIDLEVPESRGFRHERYKEEAYGLLQVIQDMFDAISQKAEVLRAVSIEDDGSRLVASREDYKRLRELSYSLCYSGFLKHFIEEYSESADIQKSAARLRRRLSKILQYHQDVAWLVETMQRRYSKKENIRIEWINPVQSMTTGTIFAGRGAWQERIMEYYLAPSRPGSKPSSDAMIEIEDTFPFWQMQYPFELRPTCHCEISLVIFVMSRPGAFQKIRHRGTVVIGCSKRSCLCCQMWLQEFFRLTQIRWMTAGAHGKPYGNWGAPKPQGPLQQYLASINESIEGKVRDRFLATLISFAKCQQQDVPSDEDRSL